MTISDCMICQRPLNSKTCKYCKNVRVCTRCYHMTHKHTQQHKYNVLSKERSYEEPLPEPV